MIVKTEHSCVLTLQEIIDFVESQTDKRAIINKLDIKKSGDYDRGTYKEELISIHFKLEEDLPF